MILNHNHEWLEKVGNHSKKGTCCVENKFISIDLIP